MQKKAVGHNLKLIAIIGVVIGLSCLAIAGQGKVTDPSNPSFDPDEFSFEDYRSREQAIEFFRKAFPPGTPKSYIDRILVDAGGAIANQNKTFPQIWHYWIKLPLTSRWPNSTYQHQFIFDEGAEKLINIQAYSSVTLYPDQPTYEDIRKQKQGEK